MSFDEGRNNSLDQVVSQDNTKDKDNHNDLLPQPSGQVSTSSPKGQHPAITNTIE